MTTERFLSKVTVRRDAPIQALWNTLVPEDASARTNSTHRLLWTLFADAPERERDFLWREEQPGTYFVLSQREPRDVHQLFQIDGPREFAPTLVEGETVHFLLRVNATIARGGAPGVRGKPSDIVMDAIHGIPKGPERASGRAAAVEDVARRWLDARGARDGYEVTTLAVRSYDSVRLDRGRGSTPIRFGVLDLEGALRVLNPSLLVQTIVRGMGRAKSFGNGLMLIRRP